ncbi:MAG: hypothetical protein LBT50_00915 [Prevotellaceae bacterium]|nr:hypothetical protein [Prevotellaceae bacterium]
MSFIFDDILWEFIASSDYIKNLSITNQIDDLMRCFPSGKTYSKAITRSGIRNNPEIWTHIKKTYSDSIMTNASFSPIEKEIFQNRLIEYASDIDKAIEELNFAECKYSFQPTGSTIGSLYTHYLNNKDNIILAKIKEIEEQVDINEYGSFYHLGKKNK